MNYNRRQAGINKARKLMTFWNYQNLYWEGQEITEDSLTFKIAIKTRKRQCRCCINPRKYGKKTRKELIADESLARYRRIYLAK